MNKPIFTISLDFELFWGVKDHRTIDQYGENILGARKAIPIILDLFTLYNIHATWATVGFLFHKDKASLLGNIPVVMPSYKNNSYSPYPTLQSIGENEETDPFHFGISLIEKIKNTPFQEIGTHTYSHYYCLEDGQTPFEFKSDIQQAIKIANENNIRINSIIFPRNQYNEAYLNIVKEAGIKVYRGNESSWLYEAKNRNQESKLRRALRLLDSYFNISGYNTHNLQLVNTSNDLINVPASRFLRPYHPSLKALDPLRLSRIKGAMRYAAKKNEMFHLWWHPHNFGKNTEENILFLKSILEYYSQLKKEYNMESLNMGEIGELYEK
jgi:peptidoglycan/xylan/chitin deacetylase (PgdA/CDA1 family)